MSLEIAKFTIGINLKKLYENMIELKFIKICYKLNYRSFYKLPYLY
jgi:hypothetical protein